MIIDAKCIYMTLSSWFIFLSFSGLWVNISIAGPPNDGDSVLVLGASVSNLPREESMENLDIADYYEVYSESLNVLPVILQVGFYEKPPTNTIVLSRGGQTWSDEIELLVERDGERVEGFHLQRIGNYQMALSSEHSASGSWTESRRNPETLRQGESLTAFFSLAGPDGTELAPEIYRVAVRWKTTAQRFFGTTTTAWQDVVFRVKSRGDDGTARQTEDLIERHYLWACWLYKFDRAASKKEFERAWELVQDYLKRPTSGPPPDDVLRDAEGRVLKAGDEPGSWNVTPRYQAMLIARWLDKHTEEFRYMQQIAAKNGAAKNGELKLKMRYYQFGPAQDQLPRNQAGELVHGLNRLYEQLHGKTMSGRRVERLPLRKHFPDEGEQTATEP